MDGDACILIGIRLSLSCDGDKLVGIGLSGEDVAVLVHNCSVAENEVYGANNVTFPVELAVRIRVESILKCIEGTPVVY